MKFLFFLLAFLSLASCRKEPDKQVTILKDTVYVHKTIYVKDSLHLARMDSLTNVITGLQSDNDSLIGKNKYFAAELMNRKLQLQNAKFYLNIANKKPSQRKFLLGWMNRALND